MEVLIPFLLAIVCLIGFGRGSWVMAMTGPIAVPSQLQVIERAIQDVTVAKPGEKRDSVEEQRLLRDLSSQLARYPDPIESKSILERYFREGSWPMNLAMAYGVCQEHRYEFFATLRDLKLLEQLSGTPDQLWLKSCLARFENMHWMEQRLNASEEKESAADRALGNALTDDPQVMSLSFTVTPAGDLVSRFLKKYVSQESVVVEKARKLHFYLALSANAREKYVEQLSEIEAVLTSGERFLIKVPIWERSYVEFEGSDRQNVGEIGGVIFLRLDPINLTFLKAEILRDRLEDLRLATKMYEDLAKLPDSARYVSIHPSENAFVKPASLYGRSELAFTLCKSEKAKQGCELWADLSFEKDQSEIQAIEERQFFCQHTLGQMERYCRLYAPKILRPRLADKEKLPQVCQTLFATLLE